MAVLGVSHFQPNFRADKRRAGSGAKSNDYVVCQHNAAAVENTIKHFLTLIFHRKFSYSLS